MLETIVSAIILVGTAFAVNLLTRRVASRKAREAAAEMAVLRGNLAFTRADFEARQEELRRSLIETREREREANQRAVEAELRTAGMRDKLSAAIEEKGRLKSEAARFDEMRTLVAEREADIRKLHLRVVELESQKTEALNDAEAASKRAEDLLVTERKAQREILYAKDEQLAKMNEFIDQTRYVLKAEFTALSSRALAEASTQLLATADQLFERHAGQTTSDIQLHHQKIETMLKPVEETIKRLDKHVEESDLARSRAETLLDEQMTRLAGASEALTNALRKPVVRGSWGQMTLEIALENAGLEPDIDFVLRHYRDGDEEGPQRTEAVINLPKGRKLIIDCKNLMESYLALANCKNEAEKLRLYEDHSRSLRGHIKALSAKEYWKRYDGLDCVILFIPHDGMYHAAIQDEAELIREAAEKRVFVTNPISLIPLLKAIRYVLDQERLNKSAEEISRVGAELYIEIARFAGNLSTIGDRLKSTVKAYNDAIPNLDTYIVAKSRRLKQLGSAKGADPEIPEMIELEPRLYSSDELRRPKMLEPNGGLGAEF